jgi:putative ATP-dependent endonuclease of OLD family
LNLFVERTNVKVCCSQVTLEYDLAEAGDSNAAVMAEVWESCFVGKPGTFNKATVLQVGASRKERALAAWRGICRASHAGSKADFAHRLTEALSAKQGNTWKIVDFEVPPYLREAVEHVVKSPGPPPGLPSHENPLAGTAVSA